ncbi:helix-turn-helix transcriptional regulator [Aquimarina gracilis]
MLLWGIGIGSAQEKGGFTIPDSLKGKSYDDLYYEYDLVSSDTTKSLIYLQSYLQKAKNEDEKVNMARAYWFLSYYQDQNDLQLTYLDSSVAVSKNLKNPFFPALAYSARGGYFYNKSNYKQALQNFFLSLDAAKRNNSNTYIYIAKNNIALIKSKLGKYDEALVGYKECLEYETKDGLKDTLSYLLINLRISEVYSKMRKLDSSSLYTARGIKISKMMKSDPFNLYYHFVFLEGINDFYRKKYSTAMDSIHNALPFIGNDIDKNRILNAYLYLGKSQDELDKREDAKRYYKKLDSVFQVSGTVSYEIREAYNALVKYYRDKQDTENQLLYIERLLEFDSILQSDYKELNELMVKQYDTPVLLAEKERLVQEATTKSSRYGSYIVILIGSVVLLIGLFSYQFYRRRLYQQRFEILTQKKDTTQEAKEQSISKPKEVSATDIGISASIVDEVLGKLQGFEDKRGYTSSKITLTQLSSSLGTNNKYLSKIINVYKEKSFSQYINDLRIDYIVERLQEDKKLRNYTIKAIARETGFNTAEVFSKAFYGKHGIYPSYFIKKLEKLEK